LDQDVFFGAGAITANFRFDEKSVPSIVGSKKIDSGLYKYGSIIGTKTKIGVNVTLLPGIKIGINKLVFPGTVIRKDVV
jgi:bifunctional UDP-N-acetylglucosamine pyrophosphorylase/glucosamine-1-phosphate N-acetyltransferase